MSKLTQEPIEPTTADPTTVATVQPTKSQPVMLDPSIYNPEGKMWKEMYNGSQGVSLQLRKSKEQLTGEIKTLRDESEHRENSITDLQRKLGEAGAQLTSVVDLRDQTVALQKQVAELERFKVLTEYPALLSFRTSTEVEAEDGTTETVEENPFLGLVGSTILSGDELRAELTRLEKAFANFGPKKEPLDTSMSGATPTPSTPVESNAETVAYERARAAQSVLNTGDNSPAALNEFNSAWAAYHEAKEQSSV